MPKGSSFLAKELLNPHPTKVLYMWGSNFLRQLIECYMMVIKYSATNVFVSPSETVYLCTEANKGHTLLLPGCHYHVVAVYLKGDCVVRCSLRTLLVFEEY